MSEKTKVLAIAGSLAFVAIVIFVGKSQFKSLSPVSDKTKSEQKPETSKAFQFEQAKDRATARFKVAFPNIKSEAAINELPEVLRVFVPESVKDATLKEVIYEDGKRGYRAEFSRSEPLLDFRSGFLMSLRMAGWSTVAGSTNEFFSFFEMKNEKYTVRIAEDSLEKDKRSVEIQIIEN